jgi:hypothetical protein
VHCEFGIKPRALDTWMYIHLCYGLLLSAYRCAVDVDGKWVIAGVGDADMLDEIRHVRRVLEAVFLFHELKQHIKPRSNSRRAPNRRLSRFVLHPTGPWDPSSLRSIRGDFFPGRFVRCRLPPVHDASFCCDTGSGADSENVFRFGFCL